MTFKMQSLSTDRHTISKIGNVLLFLGLIWLTLSVIAAMANFYKNSQFHLDLSPLFTIIMALFLRDGRYIAARRIAFIIGGQMTLSFLLAILSLGLIFYQLNINQQLLVFFHTNTIPNLVFFLGIFLVQFWVYRQLTSATIKSEMEQANIPYRPFWRYGTSRGIVLSIIVFISIACFFCLQKTELQQALKLVNTNVTTQYGASAFFLAKSVNLNKNNSSESITFSGSLYDGKSFSPYGFYLSRNTGKNIQPSPFVLYNLK